ncbi:MAG: S8 family serine peptidase [Actinomycetota bacterium]|nr:S8 family serine peptidase [Actinomycetota bacterium]
MKRHLSYAVAAALLAAFAAPAFGQEVPPTPARSKWFAENDSGHWNNGTTVRIDKSCRNLPKNKQVACSLKVFKKKPFTVIALIDTGINPYHQDFRAPEFTHHPSKYIQGYPDKAKKFDLALATADSKGYMAARKADDREWLKVQRNGLYWFPGTRVIGGISTGDGGLDGNPPLRPHNPDRPERMILDENGHGTGTASVAAGRFYGSNPNALIVSVEDLGEASLEWATSQKWIDIVSNSWGNRANLPLGDPGMTRDATRRGQSIVFSAGNGATNTNSSTVFPADGPVEDPCKCKTPDSDISMTDPWSGPSWQLTIGAASPINGQAHWWHSYPVDVSSFGSKWRAANAFGVKINSKSDEETRDFGGTSCAAPITSGVLSSIIEKARYVLRDTTGGQRPKQVVAQASGKVKLPAKGPLKDGKLTRLEAEDMVMKTAFPVEADPEKLTWDYAVRPTGPNYFMYQGYGVIDRKAKKLALDVLIGKKPLPDRAEVDQWIATTDQARDAIWGAP